MGSRVLIIDDERLIRWSLHERLREEGLTCVEAGDGRAALDAVRREAFDLILLDLRLPDTDGMSLLREMRRYDADVPIIIITAYSAMETAVQAMQFGTRDYIAKPFDLDQVVAIVHREIASAPARRGPSGVAKEDRRKFGIANLIGRSRAIEEVRELVRRVAASHTTTILLLGETGTGKDMVARAIHYESARVDQPFVNITCTALPEALLESELFGYEKGAFTDARERKRGMFELADGGTVFLDEIGDMKPLMQSKLLRVLEEKRFRRIGGVEDVGVSIRTIAATNRDLEKAIRDGSFREDLYFRLSTVPVYLPPLRERLDDVLPLADHFLAIYTEGSQYGEKRLDPDAEAKLCAYGWPGNVRELRNVIERAVVLSHGVRIAADDIVLGRSALSPRTGTDSAFVFTLPPEGCDWASIERELTVQALERSGWNQTHAARLLGLTRDQIRYRVEKYRLSPGPDAR